MTYTYIVSRVRVVVHSTKECSRSVLANVLREKRAASRVVIHKVTEVVNEASNNHKWAGLRLLED